MWALQGVTEGRLSFRHRTLPLTRKGDDDDDGGGGGGGGGGDGDHGDDDNDDRDDDGDNDDDDDDDDVEQEKAAEEASSSASALHPSYKGMLLAYRGWGAVVHTDGAKQLRWSGNLSIFKVKRRHVIGTTKLGPKLNQRGSIGYDLCHGNVQRPGLPVQRS